MRRILPLVLMAIFMGLTGGASDRGRNSANFGPPSAVTVRMGGGRVVSSAAPGESFSPNPANLALNSSFQLVPSAKADLNLPLTAKFVFAAERLSHRYFHHVL